MGENALSTGTVLPFGNPTGTANVPGPNDILTENEFCGRTKTRPRTAQRWRVTGQGPPFVRIGPRRVGYRVRDVENWLAQQTFLHRAEELSRSTAA